MNGIKFMEELRDKVCFSFHHVLNTHVDMKYAQRSKEAIVLCNTTIGMIYLTSLNDLVNTRKMIETTGAQLDQMGGVTCVHSRFYQLSSRYYQVSPLQCLVYI